MPAQSSMRTPTAVSSETDVVAALEIVRDFFKVANGGPKLPPQIIVTCRGDPVACARDVLVELGYQASLERFFNTWATPDEKLERSLYQVHAFGTFFHTHGDGDQAEGGVRIGPSGWRSLLWNVTKLHLVIRRYE